jgi:ATP-binding cassette subfamily B protein RaxB
MRIASTIARLAITRIVIAHRPALVDRADIVLKLEGGRITEVRRGPTTPAHEAAEGQVPSAS